MATITPTGKSRNLYAALTRVLKIAWFGESTSAEQAPLALSNEAIQSVNAAGTGAVDLIKSDASDFVVLPNGANIPAGKAIGDASGVNRIVPNATAKTIVDGSATSLIDVACAAGAASAGLLFYQVFASDGTDHQSMAGMVSYSCVNKAGTLTLTITNATANDAKAVSSGTLTLAWTFVTGASKGTIKLQPTGSLTETTYTVNFTVFPISGAITVL